MTPYQRGVFAAASENMSPCPYDVGTPEAADWYAGHATAAVFLEKGLDAMGRPPGLPPRLCRRNLTKVCICNERTRRECVLKSHHEEPPSLRKLLARALFRLASRIEGS